MAYQDDPTGSDSMRELVKRIRRLETGSPLGNSSITKGSLRIASAEGLIVEGSAKVTGTLAVTGILNANGTVTLTGTVGISGPLDITGNTTLSGDLTVDSAGQITVAGAAPMVLGIAANGYPGIEFPVGRLTAGANQVALTNSAGTAAIAVETTRAIVAYGINGMQATAAGTYTTGKVFLQDLATTTSAPNLYCDPVTGQLKRSTGVAV